MGIASDLSFLDTTDTDVVKEERVSQQYDKCAGINYQEGLDSLAVFSKYVNALFVDKSNPCYKMLLEEGCDVTAHNADRSYD